MKTPNRTPEYLCRLVPAVCFCVLAFFIVLDGTGDAFSATKAHFAGGIKTFISGFAQPGALFSAVESEARNESRFHTPARDALSAIDAYTGKSERRFFAYIKSPEGFLYHGSFYFSPYSDMMAYAKQVRELKDNTAMPLLFIGGTDRYYVTKDSVGDSYPVNRYANLQMDELLLSLYMNGVDTLDLSLSDIADLPAEDLYYKTDPFIKTEASLQVLAVVSDALSERYGIDLDPNDFYANINHYRRATYGGMAGELSKSAGILFGGTEDYLLFTPRYKTSLSVTTTHAGVTQIVTGTFNETLLNLEEIGNDDLYENSFDQVYLGAASRVRTITNNRIDDGAKILLVCDEYFLPFAAFLCTASEKVTVVMPLEYHQTVDVAKLCRGQDYDCIIVAFAPESISPQAFAYSDTEWEATYNHMEEQQDGQA